MIESTRTYYGTDPSFLKKFLCFVLGHEWFAPWAKEASMHFCTRCFEGHQAARFDCYGNCPGTESCDEH